ncbi:MAG: hypothetical protein KC478_01755 [Bacteriovoracaceae bacterium]|nr:hypothetical protein [Bacteriovoracaceae bacterium]
MNTEQFNGQQRGGSSANEDFAHRAKELGSDKLQEYGKEGLEPLMELFNKYGQEFIHYIKHVETGLNNAAKSLKEDQSDEDKEEKQIVSSWFSEGAQWTEKLKTRLKDSDTQDLLDFIETQGREHPAALFATSLLAGSMFGRLGKHAFKVQYDNKDSSTTTNSNLRNAGAAQTKTENDFDPQMDPRVDTAESAGTGHPRDVSGSVPNKQGRGYSNQDEKKKNI